MKMQQPGKELVLADIVKTPQFEQGIEKIVATTNQPLIAYFRWQS